MKESKISITTITYSKKEDLRILNACLSNWLSDPKILHFTSPKMTYPFNLKKWISLSYNEKNIKTIIIKIDDWIVGHLSIKYIKEKKSAHLFNLLIDPNQLRKGFAKQLIAFAEKIIKDSKINTITLNIVKKNLIALNLYNSLGYSTEGKNRSGAIKMGKSLIN